MIMQPTYVSFAIDTLIINAVNPTNNEILVVIAK